MLPDLEFSRWRLKVEENQIFFGTSNEIKRVVSQGITASVQLKLPGFFTSVFLCFPAPSLVRVYLRTIYTSVRNQAYFIGQRGDGDRFYRLPKRIKYQYGMSLAPWMYLGYLPQDEAKRAIDNTRIVNYFIENCSCGLDGVLLTFRDEPTGTRQDEWLKLFWLKMGNESHFPKASKEATAILELFPNWVGNQLVWEPKGGYGQFKKVRTIPFKID